MKTRTILVALLLGLSVSVVPAQVAAPTVTVLNDQLRVEPKHDAVIGFSIKQASRGARVAGSFRVSGGHDQEIEVSILDADQFERYRKGRRTPSYYASGRASSGQIDLVLGPGTYYLIFTNKFSPRSNKLVSATLRFRYYSGER